MLQKVRVKTFTVSESLRENQQVVKLPPPQIRVKPMKYELTVFVLLTKNQVQN